MEYHLSDAVSLLIVSNDNNHVLLVDSGDPEQCLCMPHKLITNQNLTSTFNELKQKLCGCNPDQTIELNMPSLAGNWSSQLPREIALLRPAITHHCMRSTIDGLPVGLKYDGSDLSWYSIQSLRDGVLTPSFELLDLLQLLGSAEESHSNVVTEQINRTGTPGCTTILLRSVPDELSAELNAIAYQCGSTKQEEIALHLHFIQQTWPSCMMDLYAFRRLLPWSTVFHRLDETRLQEHVKNLFKAICIALNKPIKNLVRVEDLFLAFSVLQQGNAAVDPNSHIFKRRAKIIFTYYAGSSESITEVQFAKLAHDALQPAPPVQINDIVSRLYRSTLAHSQSISNLPLHGIYNGLSVDEFTNALSSEAQLRDYRLHWDGQLRDILRVPSNLVRSLISYPLPTNTPRNEVRERVERVLNMTSEIETACTSMLHRNVMSLIGATAESTFPTQAFVEHGKQFTRYVRDALDHIENNLEQLEAVASPSSRPSGDPTGESGSIDIVRPFGTNHTEALTSYLGYHMSSRNMGNPESDALGLSAT